MKRRAIRDLNHRGNRWYRRPEREARARASILVSKVILIRLFHGIIIYKLDAEAMGSTRYRNPRGSHIEPERVARGFYGNSRVSIPRRSHWPRRLTYLEYSHE